MRTYENIITFVWCLHENKSKEEDLKKITKLSHKNDQIDLH